MPSGSTDGAGIVGPSADSERGGRGRSMEPNVKLADGRPTKAVKALQFTEVDVMLAVPLPGQKCELCERKVPKKKA